MPQMNKGGKFIFGKSRIRDDLSVRLPPQACEEYKIAAEQKVYLFTGSKVTGGFCVTRRGLLAPSKLGHILRDLPALQSYSVRESEFSPYKGRRYCWTAITDDGTIRLSHEMMASLHLEPGMALLSIRSSNIAFTMGAKGPLMQKSDLYHGEIPIF